MLLSHRNGSLYGIQKWTSPLLRRDHRSLNTPTLTEIHSAASAQPGGFTAVLHSWGLSQTYWIKTAGLNSLFPQQNVRSKQVNERTQKSAALGAQTGTSLPKETFPLHSLEMFLQKRTSSCADCEQRVCILDSEPIMCSAQWLKEELLCCCDEPVCWSTTASW